MDESTRNGIIVDAKRRAKTHARDTGESHQKSLDHIARLRGRDDWSAFLIDPVAQESKPPPAWISLLRTFGRTHPRTATVTGLAFLLGSVIIGNLKVAEFGGIITTHVPTAMWLPFAIPWGSLVLWMFATMVRESITTMGMMRRGMIDADRATLLVYTILVPIIGLELWIGWVSPESSTPLLVLTILTMGITQVLFYGTLPRRKNRKKGSETKVTQLDP